MFNPQQQANMFDRPMWHNGPRPGAFYDFPSNKMSPMNTVPDVYGTQRSA